MNARYDHLCPVQNGPPGYVSPIHLYKEYCNKNDDSYASSSNE